MSTESGLPPAACDTKQTVHFRTPMGDGSASGHLQAVMMGDASEPGGKDGARAKAGAAFARACLIAACLTFAPAAALGQTLPEALVRAYGDHDFGRGCLLARRLLQSLQPEARQAFAPQRHRRSRQAQRRGDRRCRMPLVDHQREFGSPHITLGRRAATDQRLERLSLLLRQLDDGRLPASTHEWQAYLQRSGM